MIEFNRKIPTTMATQHPDNAQAPYWETDGDGFVSALEEVQECYSAYKDLGCEEFMWDWEGKHVDEAVIDKLFTQYHDFFKKKQLGRDIFLTYRIPNIWQEKGYSLARAFMTILTAQDFARDLGFERPPIWEVILPMCDEARKMIYIQKAFTQMAKFKQKIFNNGTKDKFNYINVLPLIEGVKELTAPKKILQDYLRLHQKEYKFKPPYLRAHIARSDPALNSGLIPAVLAAKVAISEYYKFEEETGVKVFPALGAGTLPFRGSLNPYYIDDFIQEYGGIRTVYIQSAFRYDFPLKVVKEALAKLNKELALTSPKIFTAREVKDIGKINEIFTNYYRRTIERLAPLIDKFSKKIPHRRERMLHIGLFGYSRSLGKKKLPRAIPFTATFYSLGIPPELIATGRGLGEIKKQSLLGALENNYLNLKKDLTFAGNFLNKENLKFLAKKFSAFREIEKDIVLIEDYLGEKLGPKSIKHFIHRNQVSSVYLLWKNKKDCSREILAAAKIRRSLG